MKKTVSLVFSILLISISSIFAQQKEPIMSFEKLKHDYGNITQEAGSAEYKFVFTNTGAEPIIISIVKTSCGCTSPLWSKEPVAPGASGFISVAFNPKNRPGHFTKTITVTSNAKNSPVTLTITGTVGEKTQTKEQEYPHEIGKLRLNSVHVNFASIFTDQVKTQTIKIYNPTAADMKVSFENERVPKYLTIEVSPETLKPEEVGTITIVYDASKVHDWDYVRASLYLFIDGQRVNNKRINVSAIVKEKFSDKATKNPPVIEFDSEVFNFGTMNEGESVTHEYTFKNTGKTDLIIRKTRASCGCTAVNVTKEPVPPGGSGTIKATFNSKGKSGKQNKIITVITNCPSPKQNKILLKITGTVNKKQ